MYKEEKLK